MAIEELKNCPNCGGTLDNNGRCQYCGTKVYDFLTADFDNPKPIWLRFKSHGNIHMVPARLISTETRSGYVESPILYADNRKLVTMGGLRHEITMDFEVVSPEEVYEK